MIAFIKGKIIDLKENKIIILTNSGVGYEINISSIVIGKIKLNENIELFIYHHITENNQNLFGFLENTEKEIFEELIKISGIGGKVAIQILSLGKNNLIYAIQNKDKKIIESVKGIGKKMAEKIILELKDKDFITKNITIEEKQEEIIIQNINPSIKNDVISTLTNMGYSKNSVEQALTKISKDLKTLEEIIPAIIKII